MPAELAAGNCGEATVEAFITRVGKEYPLPRIGDAAFNLLYGKIAGAPSRGAS
jgi:hypothetical protein